MERPQQKEQFSNAYVRAVAATAGYTLYKPEVDDDSVDWGIAASGGKGTTRSPRIELQLKCTSQDLLDDGNLKYALKAKNYNELRPEDYQVPRILVVVLVPNEVTQWLRHSEESLAMYRCGYWVSIRGWNETPNTETVTVTIPRQQQFTVENLSSIMVRVGDGGVP
ncbi:MAG TPA: DUF4365 domain-containing protein [Phycisphaerae bacterium]|nr:DUF4365 domain-containing protein [Phycisphaerae bacterium]